MLLCSIFATSVVAQATEFNQWLYKEGYITFLAAGYHTGGGDLANVTVYSDVEAQFYVCARDGSVDYTNWTRFLTGDDDPHDIPYVRIPPASKELKLNGRVEPNKYDKNPKITGYVDFG